MKPLIALLPLVLPGAAWAHPGDHSLAGIAHLLTEPDHLALIAAAVVAAAMGLRNWRRR
ncbi:MAG: hypothetical protein LCH69_02775 [Proteobacteria bacterium]|nr:hypothetical protein [Pseudomonadota bacterium]